MNLKKILLSIGLIIFGFMTAWGGVTTFQNFTVSNLLVTGLFLVIELVVLYLFTKAK